MSVKPFTEIEAAFDLSKIEREWHGKRTKLAKNFWTLVCHYVACSTVVKRYHEGNITDVYGFLFFRPTKAFNWFRKHYVGEKTSDIKKVINFDEVERKHIKKAKNAMKRLLKMIQEIPFSEESSDEVSKYTKIDIEELDDWHPELSNVSECFSLLTAGGAFFRDEKYILTMNYDLKRHHLKELNKVADEFLRSGLILDAIYQIKRQIEVQYIFKTKIEVDGPTEALLDSLLFYPNLLSRTDKQIKYHIKNLYTFKNAQEKYIQKAIKRLREEGSE